MHAFPSSQEISVLPMQTRPESEQPSSPGSQAWHWSSDVQQSSSEQGLPTSEGAHTIPSSGTQVQISHGPDSTAASSPPEHTPSASQVSPDVQHSVLAGCSRRRNNLHADTLSHANWTREEGSPLQSLSNVHSWGSPPSSSEPFPSSSPKGISVPASPPATAESASADSEPLSSNEVVESLSLHPTPPTNIKAATPQTSPFKVALIPHSCPLLFDVYSKSQHPGHADQEIPACRFRPDKAWSSSQRVKLLSWYSKSKICNSLRSQ